MSEGFLSRDRAISVPPIAAGVAATDGCVFTCTEAPGPHPFVSSSRNHVNLTRHKGLVNARFAFKSARIFKVQEPLAIGIDPGFGRFSEHDVVTVVGIRVCHAERLASPREKI